MKFQKHYWLKMDDINFIDIKDQKFKLYADNYKFEKCNPHENDLTVLQLVWSSNDYNIQDYGYFDKEKLSDIELTGKFVKAKIF